MKSFKSVAALLLLLLAATSLPRSCSSRILTLVTETTNANVEETCRNTPNYNLCVSILKSDPRSSTADTAGLGLIMVSKIDSLAASALAKIKVLMKRNPGLRKPLSSCWDCYKAVVDADVPEAVEALTKGVPKFAEDGVADAGLEAAVCEAGFGRGKASPLTDINNSMHNIAEVARAIVRMLL